LVEEVMFTQQHHLYEELSFDFKLPLRLKPAIKLTG
jgi:hypothetical protein